jgi:hypothetical protein
MAMYDPGKLYVDPILTGFSVGYQDQQLYGERLFPITPVRTPSGRYRVYDRSNWISFPSRREPGTIANEVRGGKWAEDTFNTREHSLQASVADEEMQELHSQGGLADAVFGGGLQLDPHQDATELITRSLLLEHEVKVAAAVRDSGNYAGGHVVTLNGSAKWSDYTYVTPGIVTSVASNPVADIRAACFKVYIDTGRWPNTMTIPIDALGIIEQHPRVVDRFKNFALTDPEAWKALINVPAPTNFFIVDSKINTANSIDATESIVSLWGQDVWIGLVDPTPGQKTKTFGKTFAQTYPDGSIRPTDRWREEDRKSDLVRTSYKYDLKVVSDTAGYLIKTAVAAV